MNRDQHNELNELGLNEQERARMEQMLSEFKRESVRRAEQPEFFWQTQKSRIMANLREPERHKGLGWAATIAATTALVVFMAVPAQRTKILPAAANHAATATQATNVNDDALLESVYETTNSSVPDALAPADILASEMDRGLEGASKKTGRNNE